MEDNSSLPHSKELSNCPSAEPDQSIRHKSIPHLRLVLPSGFTPSVYPTVKMFLFALLHCTRPSQHNACDFVIPITLGEEYRSRSFRCVCKFISRLWLTICTILIPNLISWVFKSFKLHVKSDDFVYKKQGVSIRFSSPFPATSVLQRCTRLIPASDNRNKTDHHTGDNTCLTYKLNAWQMFARESHLIPTLGVGLLINCLRASWH
jgi:hypothetical protein